MELYKFQSQAGTSDAYAIRARQLDENFARVQPKNNGTYGIDESPQGWALNIFPAFPASAEETHYLTYGDDGEGLQWSIIPSEEPPEGTAQWVQVERCDGKKMYVWGTEWADDPTPPPTP
jgi:hypothetical protein